MLAEVAGLWEFLMREWPRQSGGYFAPGAKPSSLPVRWALSGILLLVSIVYLCFLSFDFAEDIPLADQPVVALVVLLVAAGLLFLYMMELCRYARPGLPLLLWIVGLGLLMRLLMFFSMPVLEVDFYRYQWDGAVTANGLNPYRYSPAEVAGAKVDNPHYRAVFEQLAIQSDSVFKQINHGNVRSIYPAVTQAVFAIAYWISPWQLFGWRLMLLFFDLLTLTLLLYLLWKLGCSPVWVVIYWLNPLVIKEVFNSGHMDVLIFPFLLAAISMALVNRSLLSALFLALATAVKVWPILLLPLFLRRSWPNWRKMSGQVGVFTGIVLLAFSPILMTGLGSDSGFTAYSQRWQLNDSLFRLILWSAEAVLPLFDVHPGHGQSFARVISGLTIIAIVLLGLRKSVAQSQDFVATLLWPVVALFLLSPTQFPWYGLWLMPFLVLVPRHSLVLLVVLLPVYYLRYWFEAHSDVAIFDDYLVWIQFVPVWWLLWREKQLSRHIDNRLTPQKVFD